MIWFGSSNIGEVDSHRGFGFRNAEHANHWQGDGANPTQIDVCWEKYLAVAAFKMRGVSIRTRNSSWQIRVSFTPFGLSERRIASVSHVAIVLMLIT